MESLCVKIGAFLFIKETPTLLGNFLYETALDHYVSELAFKIIFLIKPKGKNHEKNNIYHFIIFIC